MAKCAKCNREAASGSNYCSDHSPTQYQEPLTRGSFDREDKKRDRDRKKKG
jgi:hypothetical protein